jgi:uncharacterized repeat protein (TIGR03837 family)
MRAMWDVFCRVIDNHGDLGVCLRLSRQLAARGETVRLWVDDASALRWMAPDLWVGALPGVQLRPWQQASEPAVLATLALGAVWIEAFGCELPEAFVTHGVEQVQRLGRPAPAWINLEYLSAEPYVERMHGLPSPVMSGPAQGWTKHFFYPGFTPATGGLLCEQDLLTDWATFDRAAHRAHLLASTNAPLRQNIRLVSLFCYEPQGLSALLRDWPQGDVLLVTPGRALAAVKGAWQGVANGEALPAFAHPLIEIDQTGFDHLLWSCDLNLVRGEDSLVRALWAGQALVWHIYPQDDQAHHAKLQAFLDWLQAPESLRCFHAIWNGIEPGRLPELTSSTLASWQACVQHARSRLCSQPDLVSQLLAFVRA